MQLSMLGSKATIERTTEIAGGKFTVQILLHRATTKKEMGEQVEIRQEVGPIIPAFQLVNTLTKT